MVDYVSDEGHYTDNKTGKSFVGNSGHRTDSAPVAGGPAVDTLDSPVLDASIGNAFTVSGFAGPIVGANIYSGPDGLPVLNLTGSYTYDLPDVSAYVVITAGIPFSTPATQNHVLAVFTAGGAESALVSILYNPKAGWAAVTVLNATAAPGSLFENYAVLPVDGSQVYYPTANSMVVQPDGMYTTSQTSGQIDYQFWNLTDTNWEPNTEVLGGGIITTPYYNRLMAGN